MLLLSQGNEIGGDVKEHDDDISNDLTALHEGVILIRLQPEKKNPFPPTRLKGISSEHVSLYRFWIPNEREGKGASH